MIKSEIGLDLETVWNNRRSEMREGFHKAKEFLPICEELNDQVGQADCHKILGYCYWRFSDFTQSMEHSLKALELYRKQKNLKGEADTLNSLGAVYMFQKEHQKRLECNLQCLEIRTQLGDADNISGSMNNVGETYLEMGDLDSAERWFHDCINFPGTSSDSVAWATHNLGKLFMIRHDYPNSEYFFTESLNISSEISYHILTTETLIQLSFLNRNLGKLDLALNYARKANELASRTGAKEELKVSFKLISEILEIQGDLNGALENYKRFHKLFSEIHNESNVQRLKDIEFQYELENIRKEAEIERLKTVELKAAYDFIDQQNQLLEQRNKEIVESIRYAQRIQQALLNEEKRGGINLPEHFVFYRPKDIVSGDFYWAQEKNDRLYIAAADCTGHGVPGGFLTMLGIAFLNEIISKNELQTPAQILNELRDKFIKELGLQDSSNDGMDITLVCLRRDPDTNSRELMWAGAYNPLWVVKNKNQNGSLERDTPQNSSLHVSFINEEIELLEIKPDKQPIGKSDEYRDFTNHSLVLEKDDLLYLFSDGYQDQFGGNSGKKLKKSGFKTLIKSLAEKPLDNQLETMENFFDTWKGDYDQVDDICVIGIKL